LWTHLNLYSLFSLRTSGNCFNTCSQAAAELKMYCRGLSNWHSENVPGAPQIIEQTAMAQISVNAASALHQMADQQCKHDG
jgi:hypothetical protein